MAKNMIFIPDSVLASCQVISVPDTMLAGDAVAPSVPGTFYVALADDPLDTITVVPPATLASFNIYNEAGVAPTSIPGLRVNINNGGWVTPAAAGLAVVGFNTTTREIEFSGLPAGVTSLLVHYEQEQPGEPYSASNSVSGIYARFSSSPVNTSLSGIALAPTPSIFPINATIG